MSFHPVRVVFFFESSPPSFCRRILVFTCFFPPFLRTQSAHSMGEGGGRKVTFKSFLLPKLAIGNPYICEFVQKVIRIKRRCISTHELRYLRGGGLHFVLHYGMMAVLTPSFVGANERAVHHIGKLCFINREPSQPRDFHLAIEFCLQLKDR